MLCHITSDKPHGRGGAMCTTCWRVPLLLGVPLRSQGRVQAIPQDWQGPLHHAGVWDNPDILCLLLLQSPGIFIHFHLEWGQKKVPTLAGSGLYFIPAGQVSPQAQWLLLALGPEDPHRTWQAPSQQAHKGIQPRAAPRWKKACENARLFCAN